METRVHVLHQSDFYQVRDYQCGCMDCTISRQEHLEDFYIIFVRRGFYEQRVFRQNQEMHVGRLLISKPAIDFTIRHVANQPDLCTSFRFDKDFYDKIVEEFSAEGRWFFGNPDLHSILLTSTPAIELIHQNILKHAGGQLALDSLVVELLEKVMQVLGNQRIPVPIRDSLKKHHLKTIEHAKDYLLTQFAREVSLHDLADHCCVSMFHLSRIFREVLNTTPHRYLTEIRLHQAQALLRGTELAITDVALQCGFGSLEHFGTAYRQWFGVNPGADRVASTR